jgi:hypothetical protein
MQQFLPQLRYVFTKPHGVTFQKIYSQPLEPQMSLINLVQYRKAPLTCDRKPQNLAPKFKFIPHCEGRMYKRSAIGTGIRGLTRNAVLLSCRLIFPSVCLTIPLCPLCHSGETRRGEAVPQLKAIDEGDGKLVPWFALAARCN